MGIYSENKRTFDINTYRLQFAEVFSRVQCQNLHYLLQYVVYY